MYIFSIEKLMFSCTQLLISTLFGFSVFSPPLKKTVDFIEDETVFMKYQCFVGCSSYPLTNLGFSITQLLKSAFFGFSDFLLPSKKPWILYDNETVFMKYQCFYDVHLFH